MLAIFSLGSAAATNLAHSSALLSWEFNMLNMCKSKFLNEQVSLLQAKQKSTDMVHTVSASPRGKRGGLAEGRHVRP